MQMIPGRACSVRQLVLAFRKPNLRKAVGTKLVTLREKERLIQPKLFGV
jgi:hypothetical protein